MNIKYSSRQPVSTILPDDLILTDAEYNELVAYHGYERELLEIRRDMREHLRVTDNVGLHYFALYKEWPYTNWFFNPNVSLETLVDVSYYDSRDTFRSIINHPILFANPQELKQVWDNSTMSSAIKFQNMNFDNINESHIDSLMFLLSESSDVDSPTKQIVQSIKQNLEEIALNRRDEIVEWISKGNPDLAELPFSWLLKIQGIEFTHS